VLKELGAEVVGIGDRPDGTNINAGVGSEHPEALAARVVAEGARLGIAHDGDGDRCALCDENGGVLDGDEILTILGTHGLAHGRLVKKILVATVQSNLGVDAAIAAAGGTVRRSAVGDRYLIEEMLACGAMLGGESSGHVICLENAATGDGLVAALKVMMPELAKDPAFVERFTREGRALARLQQLWVDERARQEERRRRIIEAAQRDALATAMPRAVNVPPGDPIGEDDWMDLSSLLAIDG
jgi:phosphomannomutase